MYAYRQGEKAGAVFPGCAGKTIAFAGLYGIWVVGQYERHRLEPT